MVGSANLARGEHTFKMGPGGEGGRFDSLIVTDDAEYVPTGTGQPTEFEAELSTLNGVIVYDNSNFSGGKGIGWVGYDRWFQFDNIYVDQQGYYNVTAYYVCGEDRTCSYSVNGGPGVNVSFSNMGWGVPGPKDIVVYLNAGYNSIKFYNDSAWAPDFDKIVIGVLMDDVFVANKTVTLQANEAIQLIASVSNVQAVEGKIFELTYNSNDLTVEDLCAQTYGKETQTGHVLGYPVEIVACSDGLIKFRYTDQTDAQYFSGVVNIFGFKAKAAGTTQIALGISEI